MRKTAKPHAPSARPSGQNHAIRLSCTQTLLIHATPLLTLANATSRRYARRFLKQSHVPKELEEGVHCHYKFMWANRRGFDTAQVLRQMPEVTTLPNSPLSLLYSLSLYPSLLSFSLFLSYRPRPRQARPRTCLANILVVFLFVVPLCVTWSCCSAS